MKNKKYNIKALRKGVGGSFTASLYLGSKKIASVKSEGQFVNCIFDWKDEKHREEFDKFIESQPLREIDNELCSTIKDVFEEDADSFLADLLSKHERELWLKEVMKTCTVFRLKSDGKNEFNTFETPYCEEIKQRIIETNGDNLIEILNER